MLVPGVADAHHARFFYDLDDIVSIQGELTSVSWVNPHTGYTLRRIDENGEEETWDLAGGSVSGLTRAGATRDMFRAGDTIRVTGARSAREDRSLLSSIT